MSKKNNSTNGDNLTQMNTVLFDNGRTRLKAIWEWDVKSVWPDKDSGLLKVLVSGDAFNNNGKSTFATNDGKRLTDLDFDHISDFESGLARVYIKDKGYGIINTKMEFVVPLSFSWISEISEGKAVGFKDGKAFLLDGTGIRKEIEQHAGPYTDVEEFSDGLCKVSTLHFDFIFSGFAHFFEYEDIAGNWGYVDSNGVEVILPQYNFAQDFKNGIAIVSKGKWEKTSKGWDTTELWGGIDTKGNTVIPFKFDEINYYDDPNVFRAHVGGWEEGKWGVIDKYGKWVADPIFEDIGYEYKNGLLNFYNEDKWDDPDNIPMGIYDANKKTVLFEPQFLDVSFLDNGKISVEVYDKELGRNVEKIIDMEGKEAFHSMYSGIYSSSKDGLHQVYIRDKKTRENLDGLIDEQGKEILPCKYAVDFGGFDIPKRRIVVKENGKKGLRDFDGKELIPAVYDAIRKVNDDIYMVKKGDNRQFKYGLVSIDNETVLPVEYQYINRIDDDYYVACGEGVRPCIGFKLERC